MAKIVEKTSIDIIATVKTFEKYETMAIPFSVMRIGSIRNYICNAKKDGLLEGDFTVTANNTDEVSVITRVG